MATLKYLIKGKNELSTIYVRLRDGRDTDIVLSTGYTIEPKNWSEANGKVKQTASNKEKVNLSNYLENLHRKITDSLNDDKGNGTPINKDWLSDVIAKFKNPLLEQKTELLIDLIKAYKEELKDKVNGRTGRKTSPATLRNFNTTISRIEKFETFKKSKIIVHEVDLTFHSEYSKFASTKLGLSINSIGKDLKQIKTICLDAKDKGFDINKQVESRKFNAPSEPTTFVTLNELEIEKIKNHTFKKENGYLDNARNWLIIGCWTGCRVNDLMKLTKNNILLTPQGKKFIRYTQSKTGKQVDIPLHEDVNQIIEKLGDFPRAISDVKFNEYIKTACKLAGITEEVKGTKQNKDTHKKEVGTFQKYELVRSHTCRRSFATNHYNKLPNKLIMAVTGHATERMLLSYIGETENNHLEDYFNLWEQIDTEKAKIVQLNKAQ